MKMLTGRRRLSATSRVSVSASLDQDGWGGADSEYQDGENEAEMEKGYSVGEMLDPNEPL